MLQPHNSFPRESEAMIDEQVFFIELKVVCIKKVL